MSHYNVQNNPLYFLFRQIETNIGDRPGIELTGRLAKTDMDNLVQISKTFTFYHKFYRLILRDIDNSIGLYITLSDKCVFSGKIYTIDHFIAIDMLTQ